MMNFYLILMYILSDFLIHFLMLFVLNNISHCSLFCNVVKWCRFVNKKNPKTSSNIILHFNTIQTKWNVYSRIFFNILYTTSLCWTASSTVLKCYCGLCLSVHRLTICFTRSKNMPIKFSLSPSTTGKMHGIVWGTHEVDLFQNIYFSIIAVFGLVGRSTSNTCRVFPLLSPCCQHFAQWW